MERLRSPASRSANASSSGQGAAATGAPRQTRPARPSGGSTCLPGSPGLPFHARLTLLFCRRSLLLDGLLLAAMLTFTARMLPHAPPGGRTWAVLYLTASVAVMALARSCSRRLAGTWHPRWRALELLTLCVRTCDLGIGGVCAAMHASIVQQRAHAAAGGAQEGGAWAAAGTAARFVFASGVGSQALMIGVMRLRPGLSAVAQLVTIRSLLPHLRGFCQPGGLLSHPLLQRDARRMYAAVHWLMLGTAVPAWHMHCERGDGSCAEPGAAAAAVECQVLLTWLLLSLSLALPLLAEAASAARLFRQHERQRAAQGLPREAGPCATLYRGVGWLLLDDEESGAGPAVAPDSDHGPSTGPIRLAATAYLLLAVAWDASIWLSHRAGG